MIDPRSQKPITILRRDDGGGGMFQIPVARKAEVYEALDRHSVPYWDRSIELSSDGWPPIMSIHLSVKADIDLVQQLLDALP